MKKMRKLFLIATAVALALPLAASEASFAQDIVTASPRTGPQSTGPATGPVRSRMPLVDPAAVEKYASVTPAASAGAPGAVAGSTTGVGNQAAVAPEAYGLRKFPYTTVKSAVTVLGGPNGVNFTPVTSYPFRAAGKLWMRFGSSWFVCTASLIKKGVLVAAAHCVHNYGQGNAGFANLVLWQPARVGGTLPYGTWQGTNWFIPTVYFNGTDTCTTTGVVCNNDLALIVVRPTSKGVYPGQFTGWYGYGWNGYSFTASPWHGNRVLAQITQLGYPQAINGGVEQIRTDSSDAYYTARGNNGKLLKQQVIGSAQTGGSSGGPWIVNFGKAASYGSGSFAGYQTVGPVVVGDTSWGYTDPKQNLQGASWWGQNSEFPGANYGGYGAGNIGRMVQFVCTNFPAAC